MVSLRQKMLVLLFALYFSGCTEGPDALPTQSAATSLIQPDASTAAAPQATSKEKTAMSDETAPTEYNELTSFEKYVILEKGTERAFVGEYTDLKDPGTYICRRCNTALYKSTDKFSSHCGWPSFDDEIDGAVEKTADEDGYRVEITCKNCGGHLGHVFEGEGFTDKDTRHCVNSVSMRFVPEGKDLPPVITKTAPAKQDPAKP